MRFTETSLTGAYVVEIDPFTDARGMFARSFCADEFAAQGLVANFVQANLSTNPKSGTLRGMHYQKAPHSEVKLVRCVQGAMFDVIVDVREGSATYRDWFGVELTADNHKALYVPEGFAHGFLTLADETEANYMVSAFYTPNSEGGMRWDDPAIGIVWPENPQVLSTKDADWPDIE